MTDIDIKESKFGMLFDTAFEACEKTLEMNNVQVVGLHFHIGTQILGGEKILATTVTMEFAARLKNKLGIDCGYLDLGGGLGVTRLYGHGMGYGTDDWETSLEQCRKVMSIEEHAKSISTVVKEKCREHSLVEPTVIIEPGRYLLATAGILLCRICKIKEEPSVTKRVLVNANVNLLPYVRYKFYFHPIISNKANALLKEKIWICGDLSSWDFEILYKDIKTPKVERGDILAFLDTGAYAETWSNQWMGFPRPAAILVCKDNIDVIREKETIQDIIANYKIPIRLLATSP